MSTLAAYQSSALSLGEVPRVVRIFLLSLSGLLLGYALLGRGFAYIGIAPLYVGEITLLLGLLSMVNSDAIRTIVRIPAGPALMLFMGWSLLATIPYISRYGVMTLRDAVLWGYAVFALATASAIVRYPQVLRWLLLRYRTFVTIFAAIAWVMFFTAESHVLDAIRFPGAPVQLIEVRGGNLLVHLAGAAAFVAVGMSKRRGLLVPLLLINFAALIISKRAGMVALACSFLVLAIQRPPNLKIAPPVYTAVLGVVLALLINPTIDLGGAREISPQQFAANVKSMVGSSSSSSLETTETWRMDWWSDIVDYTFGGKYFLTGKGYGINLATDDGYQVLEDDDLRSPHSGHLNILARSGVPGFLLWWLFHGIWFVSVFRAALDARRRQDFSWHGIFTFILCYWVAFMVNAAFDVYLEGPMGGIWFWTLVGFGMGAVYVYRNRPDAGRDHVYVIQETAAPADVRAEGGLQ